MPFYGIRVTRAVRVPRNSVASCPTEVLFCRALQPTQMVPLLAVLCMIFLSLVSVGVMASDAIIEPPMPLLNVPFRVTALSVGEGKRLFVSRESSCSPTNVVGTVCTIPQNLICTFLITASSVDVNPQYSVEVPPLYLCSEATGLFPIEKLQLSVIDVIPRYVILGGAFTLTLGNATPVGSIIGFFSDDSCQRSVAGMEPITLDSSHQISISVSLTDVLRLCARILVKGDDGRETLTSFLPAASLILLFPFSVDSTQVLRHTSHLFRLSPFNRIPWATFSRSPICGSILQEPVEGTTLQNVLMPIQVPGGSYYFCTGFPYFGTRRLYVPSSNTVLVREYGMQPHTMYTGELTTMTLTLDAAASGESSEMSIALFRSRDCQQNTIISWSTVRSWSVNSAGVYYACVKGGTPDKPAALATEVRVLNPPTISMSHNPIINGLDVIMTLSGRLATNPGLITVGFSITSDCLNLVASGTTTEMGNIIIVRAPENTVAMMSLCVSTPLSTINSIEGEEVDTGYMYALGIIQTRQYKVTYGPLFSGKSETIVLDSTIQFNEGTKGLFTKDTCDKPVGSEFPMNVQELRDVMFKTAGEYKLCVKLPDALFPTALPGAKTSYGRVATLFVNGPVKLVPTSILVGITTQVQVSLAPPNAPVHIVSSGDCKADALAEGVANALGEARLQLLHTTEANLTLCVGYKGSNSKEKWVIMSVATLPVGTVKLVPFHVIATHENRVNVVVLDKRSLENVQSFMVPGKAASCSSPPQTKIPVVIPNDGHAFILYTPPESTTWTVCIGIPEQAFVYVGEIIAVSPINIVMKPSPGVAGLPASIKFDGPSLPLLKPTRFFVADTAESCASAQAGTSSVFADGAINSITGETDIFITSRAGVLVVCIGWHDEKIDVLLYGGTVVMEKFRVLSRYAIRESTNDIKAFPLLNDSSVFLVMCVSVAACNADAERNACMQATRRYYTNSLVPLRDAAEGLYLLCQEDVGKKGMAAASEDLISVVNQFKLTIQDTEVRQYRPTQVVLSGGDVNTRKEDITVFTMRPGMSCLEERGSESEDFKFPGGALSGTITITRISPLSKDVQLCIKVSLHDIFPSELFDLLSYMAPMTVISGRVMHVRSGILKENAVAKLAAAADCAGTVMNIGFAPINNYVSELRVDGCLSGNQGLSNVHYCESKDGGQIYENRGVMRLIHLKNCLPEGPTSAIVPITLAPTRPVKEHGIDKSLLEFSKLSTTSDCKSTMHGENGYTPKHSEKACFFVCVFLKEDSGYMFTTDEPTLTVANYEVTPTSIPSRLDSNIGVPMPVMLELKYPTVNAQTYLSHSEKCDTTVREMPELQKEPPRAQLVLTGVSGVKYICVVSNHNGSKIKTAVVELLVVNMPDVIKIDPVIVRGVNFRATLQVKVGDTTTSLYSLVPGADANYPVSVLYTSSFRGVFFSDSACKSPLKESEVAYVNNTGNVSFQTGGFSADITSLALCIGTPAGNFTAVPNIGISSDVIFPSRFVLGADTAVYIPLLPNRVFYLSREENCLTVDIVRSFVTNDDGYGILSFRRVSGEGLPPAGQWTVCEEVFNFDAVAALTQPDNARMLRMSSGISSRPVAGIEAFDPVHFNIRGSDIVVGTASDVGLLDDLTAESLLPGFSTNDKCTGRTESLGSWSVDGSDGSAFKFVTILAKEKASSVYLCASAPINGTIVRVPANGFLRFVEPIVSFPQTVSRCTPLQLSSCAIPGTPPPETVVSVIQGKCCSLDDRQNIVGAVERTVDNECSLRMDWRKLNDYSAATIYHVCAWSPSDPSYCTTLGQIKTVTESCGDRGSFTDSTMGQGVLITVILLVIIIVILLIAFLAFMIIRCCGKEKERNQCIVANPLVLDMNSSQLGIQNSSYVEGSELLFGHPLLCLRRGSRSVADSQRSVTQITNPLSLRGDSPTGVRRSLWEGIESDERDHIALQEARDRYNLHLVFSDRVDRIKLESKQRMLQYELSDDDFIDEYNSFGVDASKSVISVPIPSAPSIAESDLLGQKHANFGLLADQLQEVAFLNQDNLGSPSSTDTKSYTITQRFHDELRYALENEVARRQRMANWEEEEWRIIVDTEFTSYVNLQNAENPSLPSLPPAFVMPFAAVLQGDVESISGIDGISHEMDGGDEGNDDVYDAPSSPAQPMKCSGNYWMSRSDEL